MTEQRNEIVGTCPTWCHAAGTDEVHAHVSADVTVGEGPEPMVARMIQLAGSDTVRMVIGQHVVGLDEGEVFGHALLRLVASSRLAEPGLGFIETLAARAGLSSGEMAFAAGLDADRVRAQRAGGRVLNQREFDRLALAVAQLLPLVDRAGQNDQDD